MTDKTTLTIPFADESGDGEARWIRLEQVALPDEGVTMEQAAELVDALYGINPCESGMGAGGEEADKEALPEEPEFLGAARERLGLDICEQGESATWECEVDVMRSHRDDGYSLQGERITVGATTPMSKNVIETVEMNGASHDLQWPYGGDIVVSGSGARVGNVRGSTLNLKAPVRGRVRIRYRAAWDRVQLTVRRGAAGNAQSGVSLAGVLAVSGGSAKTNSRDDDDASVVAFWRDLAAECALKRPPEDDQEMDAAEIERLCEGPDTDWHVEGECWQTVEPYNLCNCSGDEAPDAPEPVDEDAPCPEGVRPGSWLGTVRRLGEYVDCPGEDDEGLGTPEFYKEHCCEEPRENLPRCRETREPYRGGAEIENGPEHWKDLYGESVRLTAVRPEGGNCGELVKVWAVPDFVEDLPVLPGSLTVDRHKQFTVTVLSGGRPPFTWTTPDGIFQIGVAAYGFMGIFRAESWFNSGVMTVVDACGRVSNALRITSLCDRWREIRFSVHDLPTDCSPTPDQPYTQITSPSKSLFDALRITASRNERYVIGTAGQEPAIFLSASGRYIAYIPGLFGKREILYRSPGLSAVDWMMMDVSRYYVYINGSWITRCPTYLDVKSDESLESAVQSDDIERIGTRIIELMQQSPGVTQYGVEIEGSYAGDGFVVTSTYKEGGKTYRLESKSYSEHQVLRLYERDC